jgi:hypothetical protein
MTFTDQICKEFPDYEFVHEAEDRDGLTMIEACGPGWRLSAHERRYSGDYVITEGSRNIHVGFRAEMEKDFLHRIREQRARRHRPEGIERRCAVSLIGALCVIGVTFGAFAYVLHPNPVFMAAATLVPVACMAGVATVMDIMS